VPVGTLGSVEPPSPTDPVSSRVELFERYLDAFRAEAIDKVRALSPREQRGTRLASGWTPVELLCHLAFVELRWLEWGFEGVEVVDPWGDRRDDRWYVDEGLSTEAVVARLEAQGARTRQILRRHDLSEIGLPSARWDGEEPPSLERILIHLLQEFARHVGHLDIVAELALTDG